MKEFKRCKSYWWCFQKAAREYYKKASGDPEEKKEQLEVLLNYVMDLKRHTKAYVDGKRIREYAEETPPDLSRFAFRSDTCTLKEFLTRYNAGK